MQRKKIFYFFASALKTAVPNLPGEAGVDELAKALYR